MNLNGEAAQAAAISDVADLAADVRKEAATATVEAVADTVEEVGGLDEKISGAGRRVVAPTVGHRDLSSVRGSCHGIPKIRHRHLLKFRLARRLDKSHWRRCSRRRTRVIMSMSTWIASASVASCRHSNVDSRPN